MTTLHVKDVEMAGFQQEVLDESWKRPVAVDFWAPWCGPCRTLGPILERLAGEFQGEFLLAKVDTETNPELAEQFDIRSIPNVKVFKNGNVVGELLGAVSETEARKFLRRHCPSAADRKHAEGMTLLEHGRTDEARPYFESALKLDPSHAGALLELGKLLVSAGDTSGAVSLWNQISANSPLWDQAHTLKESLEFHTIRGENGGVEACAERTTAEPENLDARYAYACCLAAGGDYAAALNGFLSIVARDKNFRDQAARKAMLTVFELAGARSPLAEEYRKRLALVLF